MKGKFILSSAVSVLLVLVTPLMLWAFDAPHRRPNPLMDYVPQEIGMYDTVYGGLDESYCRSCHGNSVADLHHHTEIVLGDGLCAPCHEIIPDPPGVTVIKDCTTSGCHSLNDLDTNGWHHNTEEAASWNCVTCHNATLDGSTLIEAFGPGVSFEDDPPSEEMPPPTPLSCDNCHWEQTVTAGGHPSTYDHYDDGTVDYYEYGREIYGSFKTHHTVAPGSIEFNCHMCHGFGSDPETAVMDWDPCNPEIIRHCERCHTKETLHNIHWRDFYGWEAAGPHVGDDPYAEPDAYRLFAFDNDAGEENEICGGCHDFRSTLAAVANPNILWPPNHEMVDIVIDVNVSDYAVLRAEVTSNEPIDGSGDGDLAADWTEPVIHEDEEAGTITITLQLRAERSGSGDGREYTVAITAFYGTSWDGTSCRRVYAKIVVPPKKGKNSK